MTPTLAILSVPYATGVGGGSCSDGGAAWGVGLEVPRYPLIGPHWAGALECDGRAQGGSPGARSHKGRYITSARR